MPRWCSRLLRVAVLSVVLLIAAGVGIWLLALRTPTGFLPEEDQGAFFVAVQLPDGASVSRTRAVVQQVEGLIAADAAGARACCRSSASRCSMAATNRTPPSWWCG